MTTILNAQSGVGLTQSADGSGVLKVQSNGVTTNALAWVNYNGAASTIRASYNVTSVTKNATGDYTLNYTTALSDANYSLIGTTSVFTTGASGAVVVELFDAAGGGTSPTTTAARIYVHRSAVGAVDNTYVNVAVFGN